MFLSYPEALFQTITFKLTSNTLTNLFRTDLTAIELFRRFPFSFAPSLNTLPADNYPNHSHKKNPPRTHSPYPHPRLTNDLTAIKLVRETVREVIIVSSFSSPPYLEVQEGDCERVSGKNRQELRSVVSIYLDHVCVYAEL